MVLFKYSLYVLKKKYKTENIKIENKYEFNYKNVIVVSIYLLPLQSKLFVFKQDKTELNVFVICGFV